MIRDFVNSALRVGDLNRKSSFSIWLNHHFRKLSNGVWEPRVLNSTLGGIVRGVYSIKIPSCAVTSANCIQLSNFSIRGNMLITKRSQGATCGSINFQIPIHGHRLSYCNSTISFLIVISRNEKPPEVLKQLIRCVSFPLQASS